MSWWLVTVPVAALLLVLGDYAARQRMWRVGRVSAWLWRRHRAVWAHDHQGRALTATGWCVACGTSFRYEPPHPLRFRLLDGQMGTALALGERCWAERSVQERRLQYARQWLRDTDEKGDPQEWARIEDAVRVGG